jgi:1-acyl-sn-glycerol-3-phosphate acyltransferase
VGAARCALLREPGERRRAVRATAARILRLLGIRVRASGARPPRGGVLAPNHVSYLDVVALCALADVRFVAKAEVRRWPLFGRLAEAAGAIFVDRSAPRGAPADSEAIAAAALRGELVVVFLEGTTGDGGDPLPFRSPLLAEPARRRVPVAGVGLRYGCAPPHDVASDVSWRGDAALLPHLWRLLAVRGLRLVVRFGPPRVGGDRKALAATLRDDVQRLSSGRDPASAAPTLIGRAATASGVPPAPVT